MDMRKLGIVIVAALSPLLASATTFGPEHPIASAAVPQVRPALAISPAGALLVWQLQSGGSGGLVATRLDRAGNPIDATPIAIAGNGGTDNAVAVLWLGDFYLVVFPYGHSIAGKRVSEAGVVLDADPIDFGQGTYVALASNGATTILAISDIDFAVRVVRLNAAAAPIDSQVIATSSRISRHVAAATNGAEFVVTWTQDNGDRAEIFQDDIYAVRLTANGQPLDISPIVVANTSHDETSPAVASDGRDFLIVFSDQGTIDLKRLLGDGTVINGIRFPADIAADPRITFAGDRYFLTWSALNSAAHTATVDRSGFMIDPPSLLAQSDSESPVQTVLVPGLVAYSRGNAADGRIPRIFVRQIVFPQSKGRAVRH